MEGCIYLIQNKLDGKQYIGQTVAPMDYRYKSHLNMADHPERASHSVLHRAIAKHGKESFGIQMICTGAQGEELDGLEAMFIDIYDTAAPKGYNVRLGACSVPGVYAAAYRKWNGDLPRGIYRIRGGGNNTGFRAKHYPSGQNAAFTSSKLTTAEKLDKATCWLNDAYQGHITKPRKARPSGEDIPSYINRRKDTGRWVVHKPGGSFKYCRTLEDAKAHLATL